VDDSMSRPGDTDAARRTDENIAFHDAVVAAAQDDRAFAVDDRVVADRVPGTLVGDDLVVPARASEEIVLDQCGHYAPVDAPLPELDRLLPVAGALHDIFEPVVVKVRSLRDRDRLVLRKPDLKTDRQAANEARMIDLDIVGAV